MLFFFLELVPGENAFLVAVHVVAGYEKNQALYFLVAVRPLAGKTLDALGAPRASGAVGDPM